MNLKQSLSDISQKIKGLIPKKNKEPDNFIDAESYMDDKPIIGDIDTSDIGGTSDFTEDVFSEDGKVADDFLSGLNLDSFDENDGLDGLDGLDGESGDNADGLDAKDSKNSKNSKIPAFCQKIFNKIKNFFIEEKILAIIISCLLCFLIILLILVIVLGAKTKKVVVEDVPQEKEANLPYLYELPYEDVIDSYHFSRDLKENWTVDEGLQWFELPDENMIKELDEKNTKNINEILEAAP
ncbi:MAG: hypothetical protein K6G52_00525 [Treponemataceae bacterium]|nr:hypothetical protein [Treponemataceae bacterium]